jgi:WD40 repeat protein
MKKYIVFVLLFLLLFSSACQANQPTNDNQANQQTGEIQQETIPPTPAPTSTPVPEPTETPIPTPEPTPTLDPMRTTFSVNAIDQANLPNEGPIISMAFHPENTLLANSGITSILIWKVSNLTHGYILEGHEDVIIDLAWSPDGSTLASLSADETIRLWAAPGYLEASVLSVGAAGSFDWSPNGKAIAVGSFNGDIQLWDVQTAQLQSALPGREAEPIVQLMWSPDGNMLAAANTSGVVQIWSIDNQEIMITLADPEGSLTNDLAWSPNGQYLATAHENGFVHLWNPDTWEIDRSIEAIKSGVTKIAWSPDSLMIATGGDSSSIPVSEAASGKLITGVGVQTNAWSLVWSPNGKFLVVGSAGKYTGQPRAGAFAWGPGGEHEGIYNVAVANPDAGYIYFYIRK